MMLLLPTKDIYTFSNEFQTKIIFNHDKYIGDETLFCIGRFHDLKNVITLKNGKQVTLWHLLKSIPASTGMLQPQLFQQAEPNLSTVVTIVTFQAQDRDLVLAQQTTLESKIRQVIADREAGKIFVDEEEGIWFGGANKSKSGRLTITDTYAQQETVQYISHVNRIMSSPPKKRTASLPQWGGGIQTSTDPSTLHHISSPNAHPHYHPIPTK
jgi:hypothetical protein